jgi:hypothetical protein
LGIIHAVQVVVQVVHDLRVLNRSVCQSWLGLARSKCRTLSG